MIMEPSIWSLLFWKSAFERAVKTAAQAVLLQIGGESISVNALTFDLPSMGGFALGGAVISILTSLIGNAVTKTGPSWGSPEEVPHQPTDPGEPRRADLPPNA
jgi:hypothetical protein